MKEETWLRKWGRKSDKGMTQKEEWKQAGHLEGGEEQERWEGKEKV